MRAASGYIWGHNFWTNQDLDPISTSKWLSEPQFWEIWSNSCQNIAGNGRKKVIYHSLSFLNSLYNNYLWAIKEFGKKNECLKTLQTTKLKDFYEMQQLKSCWINMGIFYGKLYYSRNRTFSLENVENFIKGTGHNWRFKFQFPHSSCTTLATYQKRPLICLHIFLYWNI